MAGKVFFSVTMSLDGFIAPESMEGFIAPDLVYAPRQLENGSIVLDVLRVHLLEH